MSYETMNCFVVGELYFGEDDLTNNIRLINLCYENEYVDNNVIPVRWMPYSYGFCIVVARGSDDVKCFSLNYKVVLEALKFIEADFSMFVVDKAFIDTIFMESSLLNEAIDKLKNSGAKGVISASKREVYDKLLEHLLEKEEYEMCNYLKTAYENEL